MVVNNVWVIGEIDIEKYRDVTKKRIVTNWVVLTDNRKQHIIERRGLEFYEEYSCYFSQIIEDPDYIFKDTRDDTAVVSKVFKNNGKSVNIILRLAVEGDNPSYKNSIITAIKENAKRFSQRLRNSHIIYEKLDKDT